MIAYAHAKGKSFNPVSIVITFESMDEANAFYAVMNHTKVLDTTIGVKAGGKVREAIESCLGEVPRYHSAFDKLDSEFKK